MKRRGVAWSGVEWSGVEWSRAEWSGVEWSGVQWSGVEWSGVEWSGVEWSGVEWREGGRGEREGNAEPLPKVLPASQEAPRIYVFFHSEFNLAKRPSGSETQVSAAKGT